MSVDPQSATSDQYFMSFSVLMCCSQGGNHFDQYEEGQLELEQASLDKPIEPVRPHPSTHTIGPAVRVDDWSREE